MTFTWKTIISIARQIACGVNYMHLHKPLPILHRDLKSANLLISKNFDVKITVIDFSAMLLYSPCLGFRTLQI